MGSTYDIADRLVIKKEILTLVIAKVDLNQLFIGIFHLVLLWLSVIGKVKRHAAKLKKPPRSGSLLWWRWYI